MRPVTQKNNSRETPIRLHCFQGNPAPPLVLEGWSRFQRFSLEAKNNFLNLLGLTMMEPMNPDNRQRVDSFCREHGLQTEDVIAAIRGCDFLFRQASALDLDEKVFHQDLTLISEGDPQSVDICLSQYHQAKTALRKQITQESVAEHGKVLMGLDWRVDNVTASNRGVQLNTTIILLTLRYRDGDRLERITLQLTPEALKELKFFCSRFEGPMQDPLK